MMLGLQESGSSKLYHCVACTATFSGLPALLVHQATHADSISSVLPQTNIPPSAPQFANTMSSDVLAATPATPSKSASSSCYICGCGEEFLDFNLMLEHKRTHVSQTQATPPADAANALSGKTVGDGVPSTSWSPPAHEPCEADRSLEDGVAIATTSPDYFAVSREDGEEHLDNVLDPTVQKESTDDSSLQEESDLDPENVALSNNNGPLMKLESAAYMKHFPVLHSTLHLDAAAAADDDEDEDEDDDAADIMPQPEAGTVNSATNADLSVAPMKKLLSQSSLQTKAPHIAKILESSRKKIVSLTKSFSPVVVLETRQKLIDPVNQGTFGNIQCGRCRRLFSSTDKLTEHHFLHKKERIKCCKRCKQLIIGKLPFPNNHICPLLPHKPVQRARPLQHLPGQNMVSFHGNNTKKVYFCPVCKHTYARRYNLKKHKCQGPAPQQAFAPPHPFLGTKNIAVGTEASSLTSVKVEGSAPESKLPTSELTWDNPARSPARNPSSKENHGVLGGAVVKLEDNSWEAGANGSSSEGQWTMPLDEDMELDGSSKSTNHVGQDPASTALRFYSGGDSKRYSCSRCQKTYTRINTLKRHLRLCGLRPHGQMTLSLNSGQRINLVNAATRPMHSCFVCGRLFNRKDNMMTHRKRCQLKHQVENVDETKAPQNVLIHSAEGPPQADNGNNWSIMSLPSVLPRRVTCECGVGFTSPKLLLQHLQKHAQESYTCPTCGETVNSWADYEVHLQVHMQSHHQLMTGRIKPSQPLLLRFQPQPSPTIHHLPPPAEAPQPRQNPPCPAPTPPIPLKKKLRILCSRCGNTFASRCSLRRHLTLKRCKDTRVTLPTANPPKALHCTHCNLDFPNTMSLIFHQRSGACKPTIKPVRCPVCLRWFATMEGLQKHMLTHKQPTRQTFRCDICQGTYSSLKSLKNHRRKIHRILLGMPLVKTEEPLASQ